MSKKEPTQRTGQRHEVLVPKRNAWDRMLGKAAKPRRHSDDEVKRMVNGALGDDSDLDT